MRILHLVDSAADHALVRLTLRRSGVAPTPTTSSSRVPVIDSSGRFNRSKARCASPITGTVGEKAMNAASRGSAIPSKAG